MFVVIYLLFAVFSDSGSLFLFLEHLKAVIIRAWNKAAAETDMFVTHIRTAMFILYEFIGS